MELESIPREQSGFPAEVVEFSATGLRLQAEIEVLDHLLPDEGSTADLDRVAQVLGTRAVLLDLYPQFSFPPRAAHVVPAVPGRCQLIGQVVRDASQEEDGETHLSLGVRFAYEPATYDPHTGMPAKWRLLHGARESQVFLEIHQAVNRLRALLQHGSALAGPSS